MHADFAGDSVIKGFGWAAVVVAGCLALPAASQVTTSYSYDVLGRLVSSSRSGPPAGSRTTMIGYDAAGNRSQYRSVDGVVAPTPPPQSPAPAARNPSFNFTSNTTNTIALATLANASVAARIATFVPSPGGGSATIAGDGQSVTYVAPYVPRGAMCEPGDTQSFAISYTVQNISGGASATGTANVNVTGLPGPRPRAGQQCP